MPRNQKKSLTSRQKKYIKARLKGESKKDAAIAAGSPPKNAGKIGWAMEESIKAKAPDLLDRNGLTDDVFVNQYLLPAANAMETKVVFYKGKWRRSDPMIAWGPRTRTNDLIAHIKGLVKSDAAPMAVGVKVVVINAANRPPRSVHTIPANGSPPAEGNGH